MDLVLQIISLFALLSILYLHLPKKHLFIFLELPASYHLVIMQPHGTQSMLLYILFFFTHFVL